MILDDIVASTRIRVEKAKAVWPFEAVRDAALKQVSVTCFEKALAAPGLSFICEVKKASPSKGLIAKDETGEPFFPYLQIASEYEAAGASAISVLTEPDYFLGSDEYLREIAAAVKVPVLRKDFIIDTYQIYEAKVLGAQAVLLICALLDTKVLKEFIGIAENLGLSALVEVHNEEETASALDAGARIIGINNRDLKTFQVDLRVTGRLRELLPAGIITVAESGIRFPDDIRTLSEYGIDAVLIGETLMCSADKKAALAELRDAAR
ncbi:MAG: indole-3-glycerol phosphate synthase TrpC [Treponema sp.]|jgi:indole-3-glycerol phosphate synthase|nr:indole-3-glycerol phosphate synthase TrpC [Treponema sp.]